MKVFGGVDDGWMAEAACVGSDPDVFFVERGGAQGLAKAICGLCPVRETCLEFALAHPYTREWGVWGGLAPRERTKVRIERGGG
jgi:WhiB family redox-sensing transcriptional regulator